MYEGIGSLCFCCGRLGHKQENCCYQIKPKEKEGLVDGEPSSIPKVSQEVEKLDPNFGAWMLVTRRKNLVRNGQTCGNNNPI